METLEYERHDLLAQRHPKWLPIVVFLAAAANFVAWVITQAASGGMLKVDRTNGSVAILLAAALTVPSFVVAFDRRHATSARLVYAAYSSVLIILDAYHIFIFIRAWR